MPTDFATSRFISTLTYCSRNEVFPAQNRTSSRCSERGSSAIGWCKLFLDTSEAFAMDQWRSLHHMVFATPTANIQLLIEDTTPFCPRLPLWQFETSLSIGGTSYLSLSLLHPVLATSRRIRGTCRSNDLPVSFPPEMDREMMKRGPV